MAFTQAYPCLLVSSSMMVCQRRLASAGTVRCGPFETRRVLNQANLEVREMALMHSTLMGAVAGMRSMTPLAAVAIAARKGALPVDNGAPRLLTNRFAQAGSLALAAGELAVDKVKSVPPRTSVTGLTARIAVGALAGAAFAPRHQRGVAALLGATAAIGATYLSFTLRARAAERYGQTAAGAVEDAIALGSAALIARSAGRG